MILGSNGWVILGEVGYVCVTLFKLGRGLVRCGKVVSVGEMFAEIVRGFVCSREVG